MTWKYPSDRDEWDSREAASLSAGRRRGPEATLKYPSGPDEI